MNEQSPALTFQSKLYPARYRGRVPSMVKMLMTVRPDWPVLPAKMCKDDTEALAGHTYSCWVNSHGAVAVYCPNGEKPGVKPDEFEVVAFNDPFPLA